MGTDTLDMWGGGGRVSKRESAQQRMVTWEGNFFNERGHSAVMGALKAKMRSAENDQVG